MIPGYWKSKHWEQMMAAVRATEKRGAKESGLMLVTGEPGVGKTEAIKRLAATVNSMFIRVPSESVISTKGLMTELAGTDATLPQKGTVLALQNAIKQYIADNNKILILDECQHLLKGGEGVLLEAVRDITDSTHCMCILVAGVNNVQDRLARFPQFFRRINRTVNFEHLTLEEMPSLVTAKCEITLAEDLTEELHRQSLGNMRNLVNGIVNLEQWAARNKKKHLTLDDIAVPGEHGRPMKICLESGAGRAKG